MKNAHDFSEVHVKSRRGRMTDRTLTVADVMTRRVITLSPHHSFSDSVSLMAKHSFRHFLVVDAAGRLVGVVSDRDILRVLARTAHWNTTSVSQFMTRDVITVKPNTELSFAVERCCRSELTVFPWLMKPIISAVS